MNLSLILILVLFVLQVLIISPVSADIDCCLTSYRGLNCGWFLKCDISSCSGCECCTSGGLALIIVPILLLVSACVICIVLYIRKSNKAAEQSGKIQVLTNSLSPQVMVTTQNRQSQDVYTFNQQCLEYRQLGYDMSPSPTHVTLTHPVTQHQVVLRYPAELCPPQATGNTQVPMQYPSEAIKSVQPTQPQGFDNSATEKSFADAQRLESLQQQIYEMKAAELERQLNELKARATPV